MPLYWQRAASAAATLAVRIVSLPPSGMASRALTARLTITCSNCEMSAFTGHRSRPCLTSSSTFSPISRRSRCRRSDSRSPRSSTCGRKRLPARERQQLPHQARGPVGVLLDLHDVLERRIGRLVRVEQEVGRHHDGGQHVVEVVRDAAGELADRLHLRALVDLVLQRALVGGLEHVDDGGLGVALVLLDRRDVEAAIALAVAGERRVDRRDLALARRRPGGSRLRAARGRARTPTARIERLVAVLA